MFADPVVINLPQKLLWSKFQGSISTSSGQWLYVSLFNVRPPSCFSLRRSMEPNADCISLGYAFIMANFYHIVSNRNNRNLTRADERSFRSRAAKQMGQPAREQHQSSTAQSRESRIYSDPRPPRRLRLVGFLIFCAMLAALFYQLYYLNDYG